MTADITAALEQVREWEKRADEANSHDACGIEADDYLCDLYRNTGLKLVEALEATQQIVDEQAEDEGLWFVTNDAATAYLQQELRRLHKQIEDRQALTEFAKEVERLR